MDITSLLSPITHSTRPKRLLLLLTLASILACTLTSSAMAAAPYFNWLVEDGRSAMAYLDGDALSDRVEVIPNQGFTQLVVSYGDQRSSVIPIGSGDSIALLKLSSGDFTGGGESDLIALTSDPVSGTYSITIISSPAGEYTVYTMPDAATDAHYRFQAEFTRGYVLELSSQAYDFVLSVQIGADETRAVYKDDGTVPATLRASVSGFNDYTLTMYNDRLAMDLWQTVSSTAQEQPLGFIVSTMVWQDGAPRLTAQRYVAN